MNYYHCLRLLILDFPLLGYGHYNPWMALPEFVEEQSISSLLAQAPTRLRFLATPWRGGPDKLYLYIYSVDRFPLADLQLST